MAHATRHIDPELIAYFNQITTHEPTPIATLTYINQRISDLTNELDVYVKLKHKLETEIKPFLATVRPVDPV